MTTYLPITRAREALTGLPEKLQKKPATVAVTRRGEPVLAILSWELYESLQETLEILADEDMMNALRQGLKEIEAGEGIPWDEAKADLRL